jgi:hypothetical protein
MFADFAYAGKKALNVEQSKKLIDVIKAVKCTKKNFNNCIFKIGSLLAGRIS